jgi:hypothetical protein
VQNTTIGANNGTYDNTDLVIDGPVTTTIDGAHRFNSLTLRNGAVVTHSPTTAIQAGKLDITITEVLHIDTSSRIDVTGRGFLGADQPGNPFSHNGMSAGFQGVNAPGSAGGYGGIGGALSAPANGVYGDFRSPNDVGSGGGGFGGGPAGNGGGFARVVAPTIVLDGAIRANGGAVGATAASGGSGGGIRIDVGTLSGNGSVTSNGSPGAQSGGAGGGGGRIALYYQNLAAFNLSNIVAFGSTGSGAPNGGAGTVYLQGPSREAGELIIDNNNVPVASFSTPIPGIATATIALNHLRVRRTARVRVDSSLSLTGVLEIASGAEVFATKVLANNTTLSGNAMLTHLPTTATASFKLELNSQTLSIDATSRIDASGRGFLGGMQPGNLTHDGMTMGFRVGSPWGAGGGYGGLGGTTGSAPNPVYGTSANPNDVGSGGGTYGGPGGNGGGLVRLVVQTLTLNGAITANGGPATGGASAGGSGGGIRLDVRTLLGTGSIAVNGSAGVGNGGGGGGGGRVAIYYQDATGFNFGRVTASGATGSGASNGQNGTVYLQQQVATFTPPAEELPVMKAEAEHLTSSDGS